MNSFGYSGRRIADFYAGLGWRFPQDAELEASAPDEARSPSGARCARQRRGADSPVRRRALTSVLRNSRLHQPANECSWQAISSRESNGSSAGLVSGEFRLECCHGFAAHRVERTVVRRRLEAGNELPVQAERRHPIADALLGAWCSSMDGPTHLLKRGTVLGRQPGQIFVNGARLRSHGISLRSSGRGQKTSFSSISRKHSAAVSPRKTVNHLPVWRKYASSNLPKPVSVMRVCAHLIIRQRVPRGTSSVPRCRIAHHAGRGTYHRLRLSV